MNDLSADARFLPDTCRFIRQVNEIDRLVLCGRCRISFTCHKRRQGSNGYTLRRAFTIFELLMVLAVLVMIAGLLWPALENLNTEYSLRQAGQLVQARMAGARVHAIDLGVPYQFRYEPGGRRFLVMPYDQQLLASQAAGTVKVPRVAGTLPSTRAAFDSTGATASGGPPFTAEWLAGISNADEFTGVNWSAPIVFHPDGTAGMARIVIRDKKSRFVAVSVRPLTGGVSVSKIENGGTH